MAEAARRRRGRARRRARARPELGSFGFDTAGMDTTVLAGDNFYNHANGTWAKNTPIPADKSNYGMFTKLDDISRERTRLIIEEQAKDPASKIGLAYNAFLDSAAIEAKGLAPFQPWLGEIKGIYVEEGLCRRRRQGRPHRHRQPDRRLCRAGRQESRPLYREHRPVGARASRPRLLPLARSQAGRHPRQVSRPSDPRPDAGGRGQCRRARQGDRRLRDQDRAGALDADRQPRRDQDLQSAHARAIPRPDARL